MKKLKTFRFSTTALAITAVSVFVLTIIPLLYVSFFSHPTADDFGFSADVRHTVLAGGNIFEIISAAFKHTIIVFKTWQGAFTATFLTAIQPAAFSDGLYFITTFLFLLSLVFATFFLVDTVLFKWLNCKRAYAVIVSCILLTVQIQFMPSMVEAFYWFNGGLAMLSYAFSLILYALVIRILLSNNKKTNIIYCILASIIAFLLGGAHLNTALLVLLILCTTMVVLLAKKQPKKSYLAIILIIFIVAFLLNCLAPGNSVRAEKAGTVGQSPITAVFLSVFYSMLHIGAWSKLPQLISFAFLIPILYIAASKCSCNFKYPLITIPFAFLLFASQYTPSLYALNTVGADRQMNIYYCTYCIFVIFSLFYFCGWVNKKYPNIMSFKKLKMLCAKNLISFALVFVTLFVIGSHTHGIKNLASVNTTLSIMNGTVFEYDKEYSEIIEQLENAEGICEIEDVKTVPEFFWKLDIQEDPDFWKNNGIATYYGLDKVKLKEN